MTIVCKKYAKRRRAERRAPGVGRAEEPGGGVLDGRATTL